MKKQMIRFLSIAFFPTYALGILMGVGYYRGADLSIFPLAQMLFPAAGVMVAAMTARKNDNLLPRKSFTAFLIATICLTACAVGSVLFPSPWWYPVGNLLTNIGSVIMILLLYQEKRERLAVCGFLGRNAAGTASVLFLFILLYFIRPALFYLPTEGLASFTNILKNPVTWRMLLISPFLLCFQFVPFLGEEYGWRFYLQPIMQKKFGTVKGVILLGILWGIWHLPLNFFYYNTPADSLSSILMQQITCVSLGVFFAYAYMKTQNLWTVVALHYLNNSLAGVVASIYAASESARTGQGSYHAHLLYFLTANVLLFMWVLFTKYFREPKYRPRTMDELADAYRESAKVTPGQTDIPDTL